MTNVTRWLATEREARNPTMAASTKSDHRISMEINEGEDFDGAVGTGDRRGRKERWIEDSDDAEGR
jgi:hypothetical protein